VIDVCHDDAVYNVTTRAFLDTHNADSNLCFCMILAGHSSRYVDHVPNAWMHVQYEHGNLHQKFEVRHKTEVNTTHNQTFEMIRRDMWTVLAFKGNLDKTITTPACLSIHVMGKYKVSIKHVKQNHCYELFSMVYHCVLIITKLCVTFKLEALVGTSQIDQVMWWPLIESTHLLVKYTKLLYT